MNSNQVKSDIQSVLSHRSSWREALERVRFSNPHETDSEEASAHASYWQHELRAFDEAFNRLEELLVGAEETPDQAHAEQAEKDTSELYRKVLKDGLKAHSEEVYAALRNSIAEDCPEKGAPQLSSPPQKLHPRLWADVIKAWADGHTVEMCTRALGEDGNWIYSEWRVHDNPVWYSTGITQYRIKQWDIPTADNSAEIDKQISKHIEWNRCWNLVTSRPFTYREADFAQLVIENFVSTQKSMD